MVSTVHAIRMKALIFEGAVKYLQRGWCKCAFAVDKYSRSVLPTDADAVKWDLKGAIWRSAWTAGADTKILNECYAKVLEYMPPEVRLTEFNDRQGNVEPLIKILEQCHREFNV